MSACTVGIACHSFRIDGGMGRYVYGLAEGLLELGITPKVQPIRGGTDGARLSFEGLPCPNLCAGGENFHGRFEYVPVEDMEKITELLATIIWNIAK